MVCDTGAVVVLATGSSVHARDLLYTAAVEGVTLAVPAAAYAAAWAGAQPAGRWFLDEFLDLAAVVLDPLDAATARAVGVALAGRRASLDLGQAVVSARARGWPVLATDSAPLVALAPDVSVEALP